MHRHYFLPQPDSNLNTKVGESVVLTNNVRYLNLDVYDAIVENNNVIENLKMTKKSMWKYLKDLKIFILLMFCCFY